jgi:hypothetical protein
MDNWQRNIEVIARGGGSPQARSHGHGGDCRICNPDPNEYDNGDPCEDDRDREDD